MSDCPCHGDLRHRIRGLQKGDLQVGWTSSWTSSGWEGCHAVFSHEAPTETRAGRGWAVCACEPGSTRLGRGWAVIYGKDDAELVDAFDQVPERAVLILLYPGELPGDSVRLIELRAEQEGREVYVRTFDAPAVVVLPRSGADPISV